MLIGATGGQCFKQGFLLGEHGACFDSFPLVATPVVQLGVLIREMACLSYMLFQGLKIGLPVVGVCHCSFSDAEVQ